MNLWSCGWRVRGTRHDSCTLLTLAWEALAGLLGLVREKPTRKI
ncbi:hypothetical protein [Limisphaera ngatamarikiensis]|nr:hypothetical protein [Limisphaera ngatamarikiensis]